MLKELDVDKKDVASELIKKAPGPPETDFVIRNRLNRLKDRQEFNNDNNNNNNNLSPPPSPPSPASLFSKQPHPPPPPTFTPFQQNLPQQRQFPTQPTFPSTENLFGSQTQTFIREKKEETRDKILDEIDDKIYEILDLPPKIELGDVLATVLGTEAEDILKEEFVNSKELEDKALENIKEE